MYPEYEKVKKFMDEATLLLNTDMEIKDIYHLIVSRNKKQLYALYVNQRGKIKGLKYKDFEATVITMSGNIAKFLKDKEKDSIVGLKLANTPNWGAAFYALLMAGFKPLLIDAKMGKEGTINLLNQSHAVALVSDDLYEYDYVKLSTDDLLRNKYKTCEQNWANEVIFCSSGTTGDIKLMIYNGKNLCHQVMESLKMPEETKDLMYPKQMGKLNILAMVPFHHIFGFVAVFLWFTFYGKTLVFPASSATKDILGIIQKGDVTHIFSVPLLFDSLVQSITRQLEMLDPSIKAAVEHVIALNYGEDNTPLSLKEKIIVKTLQKKLLGRKVRYCISGGGYLSEATSRIINGLGYPLYNGFGMTEVGVTSVELSSDIHERTKCAIGHPLNGVEYKILPGEKEGEGELVIKSGAVHIREIIGGKEGPASIDKDGYFHTGDIAACIDGKYYIKGRIKDIIINADGENIFPDEIEFYFKKVNKVTNLCVLGIKKKASTNESIVLVLEVENSITDEEFEALKTEVKEIAKHLPKKVQLEDIFIAKGKLPVANNMKVKRFVLKKALEEGSTDYVSISQKVKEKSFKEYDPELVKEIREPLRDAFSKILYLPKFKISDSGHWINDLGGDSMSYVELLQYVESYFGVKIPEEKYGQLTCINDFTEEILRLKENKNK